MEQCLREGLRDLLGAQGAVDAIPTVGPVRHPDPRLREDMGRTRQHELAALDTLDEDRRDGNVLPAAVLVHLARPRVLGILGDLVHVFLQEDEHVRVVTIGVRLEEQTNDVGDLLRR